MPYTKNELDELPFYQELTTKDESSYLDMINEKTENGLVTDGILRDKNSKKILLFEKIIPGQGTDESSYPENYTISWTEQYFKYEKTEEINKVIKREFTEF
tara:strand:- start:1005 stop:1307 length:303 start_codon:yes stop_codon:yes gene_type:complete